MRFDKTQKKALKYLGVWRLTKKRINKAIRSVPNIFPVEGITTLVTAFCWAETKEGAPFWEMVEAEMLKVSKWI